jgi:hypothetical protein
VLGQHGAPSESHPATIRREAHQGGYRPAIIEIYSHGYRLISALLQREDGKRTFRGAA